MARSPKTPETKPAFQSAHPPVTLTAEALQQLLGEAVSKAKAELLASLKAEAKPANGKSSVSTINDAKVLKAFAKAGYKNIQPRVNILTFNKWIEQGRRVIEGSRSIRVANLRLFHIDQTRPLTKDDQAKMKEQKAAHDSRKGNAVKSKVVPINGQAEIPL